MNSISCYLMIQRYNLYSIIPNLFSFIFLSLKIHACCDGYHITGIPHVTDKPSNISTMHRRRQNSDSFGHKKTPYFRKRFLTKKPFIPLWSEQTKDKPKIQIQSIPFPNMFPKILFCRFSTFQLYRNTNL